MVFKKIKAFWDLTRLSLGILAGISAIEGALLSALLVTENGNPFQNLSDNLVLFLLGFLIPMAIVSAAMALNDYYDHPIDAKNNRLDRPLVRGDLSPNTVKHTVIILYAFGITASLVLQNVFMTLLVLIFVILSVLYSYQSATGIHSLNLKRRGMIGNIVVSSSYLAPFVLGSLFWILYKQLAVNSKWIIVMSLFVTGTLAGTLGREVLKGLLDIQGDAKHGIKTIAVTMGETRAKLFGALLMTIGLIIFYIIAFITFTSPLALGASLLFLGIATISCFKTLEIIFHSGKESGYHGLRGITRAALWFITFALLFGIFLEATTA